MMGPVRTWVPDLLTDFEQTVLPLRPEPEIDPSEDLRAVLVRPQRRPETRAAVLYVHGWNDYFFQRHLAEHWAEQGYAFHALDLRRYGRSWSEGQLMGFTTDLGAYAEELDAAVELIMEDHDQLVLMGHSTGGLVASLYADSRPGRFTAVVLNSPWLDLQGSSLVRALGAPLVNALGGQRPTTVLPLPDAGFYKRALHASEGGEWDYDLSLKSTPSTPVRVGWLRAVLQGHARIAAGLHIDCPVLVLASTRTSFARRWSDELTKADIVLDVEQIAARATRLGPHVTVVRIADGMHDLVLSGAPVRAKVFAEIDRWLSAYGPHDTFIE